MKIMNKFKKKRDGRCDSKAQALYTQLTSPAYQMIFKLCDMGEGMSIAEEVICQYWKPRYLLDHNSKCAYEFMTDGEILTTVTENDIDWNSLKGLPEECIDRAHKLDAHFPTRICTFENGVAEVCWELNPDGRYYMDDDGYGMTSDKEVKIFGYINRKGLVLAKFRSIDNDWDILDKMFNEAKRKAK